MTIDKAKLKALAETFPDYDYDSNQTPFFNGPSGESLGGDPTGFYCVYGPDFEIYGEGYDGVTLVEACPRDQAKFICEAKAAVLALLAEIEQLTAQVRLAGVSAEMTAHEAVGRAATDYLAVVHERDGLKAEVARSTEREILQLAEIEALRKKVGRARVVAIPSKDDPKYWDACEYDESHEGGPVFHGSLYANDLLAALKADGITVSEIAP